MKKRGESRDRTLAVRIDEVHALSASRSPALCVLVLSHAEAGNRHFGIVGEANTINAVGGL